MPETYDRSNTYERVVDGQVVERVQPLDGDYEDTRLGLLALEGRDGWRLVDAADDPTDVGPEEPRSNNEGLDIGASTTEPPVDKPTKTTKEK